MCGIAGFIRHSNQPADKAVLVRMLDKIVHRGPDHVGTYVQGAKALGNTRLQIIDLAGGNQPIFNEDNSVVVVYNGEIYNYLELREELLRKGHKFRTNSDTEVLVHLYEEHGIDFVKRLNGIFAFALHDIKRDEVFIARDRFGVKPLFYMQTGSGFYFGSELNTLKVVDDFRRDLDYQAVGIYLNQGYIPQPWTVFKDVRRLEAGHYLRIKNNGSVENQAFFDVDFRQKTQLPVAEVRRELISLLKKAVERQLMSDVPVGIFLSGGLDSCSLLALVQEAGRPVDTFTLSFADKRFDENVEAAKWAAFFKTRHHAYVMNENDLLQHVDARMDQFGEPLGPWINSGQKILAGKAYENGFKVMLSGAGGDELFCGYPTLNAAVLARYYRKLPSAVRNGLIGPLANKLPAGRGNLPLSFKLKSFVNAVEPSEMVTFFNFKTVVPRSKFSALLSPAALAQVSQGDPAPQVTRLLDKVGDLPLIDALQYMDIKNFLEGSILGCGDSAAMSSSVEERFPFLDNVLVDFAASIPVDMKFSLFSLKALFKASLHEYLLSRGGGELLGNYKKRGYWLPANDWIRRAPMRDYVANRLSRSALEKVGFFDPEGVRRLLDDHVAGRQNNDRPIQNILGLQHFLERNIP